MKKLSSRVKKVLILIAVLIGLFLWSIPLLLEYYLEKKDVEWIGREVEVTDIDFNPFTGKVAVYNAFLYERDGSTPFISIGAIETNIRWLSFLKSVFELEYVTITDPVINIIQNGDAFNFDDLIPSDSTASNQPESSDEEFKFIINEIALVNGTFRYNDQLLSSEIALDRIGVEVPRFANDQPSFNFKITGTQAAGGELDMDGNMDFEKQLLSVKAGISDWQLRPYKNYLNSYLAIQDFAGLFNLELNLEQSISDNEVAASAYSNVENFLLVDNNSDSLITWNTFEIFVDSVNTSGSLYDLGAARLEKPRILIRYFEEGDNFSGLLIDTTATETLDTVRVASNEIVFQNPFQYMAEYLYYLVDEEVLTTYGADSMIIENGRVTFVDYSHLQDATITMDNLKVSVPAVAPEDSTLALHLFSNVNKTAVMDGSLILFRSGLSNLDLQMSLKDFYVSAFDPYSRFYTAFPVLDGKMDLTSANSIRNYQLISDNKVFIQDIDVGKKLDMKSEYNIPLRFAVSLLKDVNGNVDLEIPIEGDLNDPEYKFGKVVLKVIMNLLSKAVASPYNMLARAFDADEDDLKSIRFLNDQDSLGRDQTKTMDLTARILQNKNDLKVKLEYFFNEKAEKDALSLKYGKQLYLADHGDSLGLGEWTDVDDRDSLFVQYVNQKVGGLGQRTIASMCMELVGPEKVNERVAFLRQRQRELVGSYMYENMGLDSLRAPIIDTQDEARLSTILQPTFMITYDVTEIPDSLASATVAADTLAAKPSD